MNYFIGSFVPFYLQEGPGTYHNKFSVFESKNQGIAALVEHAGNLPNGSRVLTLIQDKEKVIIQAMSGQHVGVVKYKRDEQVMDLLSRCLFQHDQHCPFAYQLRFVVKDVSITEAMWKSPAFQLFSGNPNDAAPKASAQPARKKVQKPAPKRGAVKKKPSSRK